MTLERQNIYGWPIAIDLFLGSTGAGAFLSSLALNLFSIRVDFARLALLASPLLVLAGTLFLLADIAIRRRVYRLFANLHSWMSRGTWILSFFMLSAYNYALVTTPSLNIFSWLNSPALRFITGFIAALCAFLVILYPGILMGTIRSVPLWNTRILPALFLFSGLSNGLAFLIILLALIPQRVYGLVELIVLFCSALLVLSVFQLAALYAFIKQAAQGSEASRESLRLLAASRFILKTVVLGLFLPMAVLLYAVLFNSPLTSLLTTASALMSLAGGLYQRYAILRAGVFLPRFTLPVYP